MAVHIKNPSLTFIHIPKTGGSSIENWLIKNCNGVRPKKSLHCNLQVAKTLFEPIGISFCVVRNSWDWCVSWYEYKKTRCQRRIEFLTKNPRKINTHKKKNCLESQKNILNYLNYGFKHWVKNTKLKPQHYMAKDCNVILNFENLEKDFYYVQQYTQNFSPLPCINVNQSRNRDYSLYYDDESIDIVYKKFYIDIANYDMVF